MITHALRLTPGQDLKPELQRFTTAHSIRAGLILTAVGSLAEAHLRLADAARGTRLRGTFEIVSLVGTLCLDGAHLHISLADGNGDVTGGHLLEGCPIHTTAEIVIGEVEGVTFHRRLDGHTGYRELSIRSPLPPKG